MRQFSSVRHHSHHLLLLFINVFKIVSPAVLFRLSFSAAAAAAQAEAAVGPDRPSISGLGLAGSLSGSLTGKSVGTKVEANFKGRGMWYSGKIARDRGDGTYDISYDNGDSERRVKESLIRLVGGLGGPAGGGASGRKSARGRRGGDDDLTSSAGLGPGAAAAALAEKEALKRFKGERAVILRALADLTQSRGTVS